MSNGRKQSKYCINTTNHEGKKVVFLESLRKKKTHVDLRLVNFKSYFKKRILEALKSPDIIYADYNKPTDRWAYYKEEYVINGIIRYTKVVVTCRRNPLYITTAYRPSRIKEKKIC